MKNGYKKSTNLVPRKQEYEIMYTASSLNNVGDFECRNPKSPEDWDGYYRLRHDVYVKEFGYVEDKEDLLCHEKDEYDHESHSIPIILTRKVEESSDVVACLRLIIGKSLPHLPYQKQLEIHTPPLKDSSVEISRLIIAPEYRGGYSKDIIKTLVFHLQKHCAYIDAFHCVAAIDPVLYRLLRCMGFPIKKIGPVGEYWGKVLPVVFCLTELRTPQVFYKLYPELLGCFPF